MMIPLRGGAEGLVLSFDVEDFVASASRPNVEIEKFWAGMLTVLRDRWPDWPIEVWGTIEGVDDEPIDLSTIEDDDEEPEPLPPIDPNAPPNSFTLSFMVFFGGEERSEPTVAAMAAFVVSAATRALPLEPNVRWGKLSEGWKPLWAVDDEEVLRLYASEATVEESVYLLGSYGGVPTLFAASMEAWPLQGASEQIGVQLADADPEWAWR